MKTETVHEMGTKYLVIRDACLQEGNNMAEMLMNHEIKGILKPVLRRIDGESSFYYKVGGLLTFHEYFCSQEFGKEKIEKLFYEFFKISELAGEYLIEDYELLTAPESIFLTPGGEVYMPFLPLQSDGKYNETGIVRMIEQMIPFMDHTNKELIHFVYHLHGRCKNEQIGIRRLYPIILEEKPLAGMKAEKKGKTKTSDTDKKQWFLMAGFFFLGGVITAVVLQSELLCYEISGRYDRGKVMVFLSIVILAESYAASKLFHENNI